MYIEESSSYSSGSHSLRLFNFFGQVIRIFGLTTWTEKLSHPGFCQSPVTPTCKPRHYAAVTINRITNWCPTSVRPVCAHKSRNKGRRSFQFGGNVRRYTCSIVLGKQVKRQGSTVFFYIDTVSLKQFHEEMIVLLLLIRLLCPRFHRAEALSDDACLTSVWRLSVCRVHRA